VVALDPTSGAGFWLTHSTPKFPASSGSSQFYFPASETIYGQTFMCVELSSVQDLENIGEHLMYIKPFLYFSSLTAAQLSGGSGGSSNYPNLLNVLNGQWARDAGTVTHTLSVGGRTFTTLGKNSAWNQALWGELVAPTFKQPLVVQSWIRGYAEGAYCPPAHPYQVVDTENLALDGIDWTEGSDHAKWAVSSSAGSSLACIGDINRMTSQFKRGGGAICVEGTVLHAQLLQVAVTTDHC
jgi:deoxyribonuclease-2